MNKLNYKKLITLATIIAHLPISPTNKEADEVARVLNVPKVEYWKDNGVTSLVVYPTDNTYEEYWAAELIRDIAEDWKDALESTIYYSTTVQTYDWLRLDALSNLMGFDALNTTFGVFYTNASGNLPWLKIVNESANIVFEYTIDSFVREFG